MQVGQLSQQIATHASSSGGFIGNIVDLSKNETCKSIELRNRVIPLEPKVSEENKESSEVGKRKGGEVVVGEEGEKIMRDKKA